MRGFAGATCKLIGGWQPIYAMSGAVGLQCVESPYGRVTSYLIDQPPNLGGQALHGGVDDGA